MSFDEFLLNEIDNHCWIIQVELGNIDIKRYIRGHGHKLVVRTDQFHPHFLAYDFNCRFAGTFVSFCQDDVDGRGFRQ